MPVVSNAVWSALGAQTGGLKTGGWSAIGVSVAGALVGRSPARLPGQMTQLGRALHKAGCPRFETQDLPSGEILYRYVAGEDA